LYRIRSVENLIGKYQELEKQQINSGYRRVKWS